VNRLTVLLGSSGDSRASWAEATDAAGWELGFCSSITDLSGSLAEGGLAAVELGVVDGAAHDPLAWLERQHGLSPVVLVADVIGREAWAELLQRHRLYHVVGSSHFAERIPSLLSRVADPARDPMAPPDAGLESIAISSSLEKESALGALAEHLRAAGVRNRFSQHAQRVADELLTNALYDAPTDANGTPRYRDVARTEVVELPDHERATFLFGVDGRGITVAIRDPFGSLTAGAVHSNLARASRSGDDQIRATGGGAGLGLYMILDAALEWTVAIEAGRKTEMICVLGSGGRFGAHRTAPKSFSLFATRPRVA